MRVWGAGGNAGLSSNSRELDLFVQDERLDVERGHSQRQQSTHARGAVSAQIWGVSAGESAPHILQSTDVTDSMWASWISAICWCELDAGQHTFLAFPLYPGCSFALIWLLTVSHFPLVLSQNKPYFKSVGFHLNSGNGRGDIIIAFGTLYD